MMTREEYAAFLESEEARLRRRFELWAPVWAVAVVGAVVFTLLGIAYLAGVFS